MRKGCTCSQDSLLRKRGVKTYDTVMAGSDVFDTSTIVRVSQRHGVTFLAVFGSTARGEATGDSDVDVLVAFDGPKSLLDLVQIEREFSESLGHKVDLLTESSVSPYIRDRIKADMRVIYDRRA